MNRNGLRAVQRRGRSSGRPRGSRLHYPVPLTDPMLRGDMNQAAPSTLQTNPDNSAAENEREGLACIFDMDDIDNVITTEISASVSSSSRIGGGDNLVPEISVMAETTDNDVQKLLECPVCYEVILPPVILCNGGHAVCNACKERLVNCPTCRSNFTDVRNEIAEGILERCLIRCKHHDSGCRVSLTGNDLSAHQKSCEFGPLYCWECAEGVPYHLFIKHLGQHENWKPVEATECDIGFKLQGDHRFCVWEPTWIQAYNHDFFCFMEKVEEQWWLWISCMASLEACRNFIGSITVWNSQKRTEMKFSGPVNSIRSKPGDVLNGGLCLAFKSNVIQMFLFQRTGMINVHIEIENIYGEPRFGIFARSPTPEEIGNANEVIEAAAATSSADSRGRGRGRRVGKRIRRNIMAMVSFLF